VEDILVFERRRWLEQCTSTKVSSRNLGAPRRPDASQTCNDENLLSRAVYAPQNALADREASYRPTPPLLRTMNMA
jgi:hypothetical protein